MSNILTLDALSRKAEPRGGPFTVEMDGEVVYTELEWDDAVETVIDVYITADTEVLIRNDKRRVVAKVLVEIDEESNQEVSRIRNPELLEELADAFLQEDDNNQDVSEDDEDASENEYILYSEDQLLQAGFTTKQDAINAAHHRRGSGFEGDLRVEDTAGVVHFVDKYVSLS
jgi:hypothetical protein